MSNKKSYKPDWTPKNAGSEFAVNVVKGVNNISGHQNEGKEVKKTQQPTVEELVKGVLGNDMNLLARCITLIESNSPNSPQIILIYGESAPIISTFPYFEDFETSDGFWTVDGNESPSWNHGVADGDTINDTGSGNN